MSIPKSSISNLFNSLNFATILVAVHPCKNLLKVLAWLSLEPSTTRRRPGSQGKSCHLEYPNAVGFVEGVKFVVLKFVFPGMIYCFTLLNREIRDSGRCSVSATTWGGVSPNHCPTLISVYFGACKTSM